MEVDTPRAFGEISEQEVQKRDRDTQTPAAPSADHFSHVTWRLCHGLEGTRARVGCVDSSLRAKRNDLECDQLQLDIALVPHQVHVSVA